MLGLGEKTAVPTAGDLIKDGTEASFMADVIEASREVPVIVDFWATWCSPCLTQGPIVEELAEEIGEKAIIAKLDVDENQDIAGEYGVMSIPTLLIFKDGEVVDQLVGVHQKQDLIAAIEKHS